MDRRTKIMTAAFGLLVVYGLVDQVVYPVWIEPALTIDDRIAERREQLDELERIDQRVQLAKRQYFELASRLGSMDVGRIETDLRDRINQLIERHNLTDMQVSRTKPTRVGKNDLRRMRVVVKADASLESAMGFLRDVAELPHVIRVENVKMIPARSRKKGGDQHRVSLTIPIEVRILPQQKIPGKFDDSMFTQKESHVRHADRSYAPIWEGKPFWEYVPPIPLRVQAGRPLQVKVGKRATLSASANGGDKNYSYLWSPATRLKTPNQSKTDVDTSDEFTETYTVTVTDGTGKAVTASVRVTVAATKVAVKRTTGPLGVQIGPPVTVDVGLRASLTATISGGQAPYKIVWSPSDRLRSATQSKTDVDTNKPFVQTYEVFVTDAKGDKASASVRVEAKRARWKNAKYLQLRMALMRSKGEMSLHELMVYNNKKKREEYYALGDEFDGGELVFVHPTGGLVRRRNEYFIYPIGGWVDQDIKAEEADASEHPWLIRAAQQDRKRREAAAEAEAEKKRAEAKTAELAAQAAKKKEGLQEAEKQVLPGVKEEPVVKQNNAEEAKKPPPSAKLPTAQQQRKAVKRPRLRKRTPQPGNAPQDEKKKKSDGTGK